MSGLAASTRATARALAKVDNAVTVALTSQFDPAALSAEAAEGLAEWRDVVPELDPGTRRQLPRVATSFGRFSPDLAEIVIEFRYSNLIRCERPEGGRDPKRA